MASTAVMSVYWHRFLTPLRHVRAAPLTACGAVYAAAYIARVMGQPPERQQVDLLANLAFLPAGLAVYLLARRVSAHPALGHQLGRAWRLIALAFLCLLLGELAWFYVDSIQGVTPRNSWANIPYLLYYPTLLWGLLSFPLAFRSRMDAVKFGLDAATVVVGGGMVVWHLVLRPTLQTGPDDPLGLFLSLVYPVGDLLSLLGIATILLRRSPGRERRPLAILAVGLLLYLAGNVMWARSADGADLLYMLAYLFLLASAEQEYRRVSGTRADTARPFDEGRTFSLLPYAAVAVGYGLLLKVSLAEGSGPLSDLVIAAVLLTVLVVARQIAAVSADLASEARFRALVQHASDVITILDLHATVRFVSPSLQRLFGYNPADFVGRRLTEFVHPEDLADAVEYLTRPPSVGAAMSPVGWRLRRPDGSYSYVENVATNLLNDRIVGGVVLNTRDISERVRLEQRLSHQAFHDPLTSLANRVLFRDRVEHALARAQRREQPLSVLFLDLDSFKTVNDSLGHAAGDRLLVMVSERLLSATRGSDTVARLGGDEFAALLENARADGEAVIVAERITAALRRPFVLEGKEVYVGSSIGIAGAFRDDGVDDLLRNADVAMYTAKARGKGRHEVFAPEMQAAALDRLQLEAELRRAVQHREFVLHYQPIMELGSGRIMGVEALLRWNHPSRGQLLPASFIALAEDTGLIVPIGRWILRQACREVHGWQARRPDQARFTLFLNLSTRQLHDPDLVRHVAGAIVESGLEARDLVLEITESVLTQNPKATNGILSELKELGVRLAIDHFGTGYSSLAYLQRFSLDILKIPKSFIRGVESGDDGSALARAILALSRTLGMSTIADGIESAEQLDRLRQFGCEFGQGYYFAEPLTPEAVEAFCKDRQSIQELLQVPATTASS